MLEPNMPAARLRHLVLLCALASAASQAGASPRNGIDATTASTAGYALRTEPHAATLVSDVYRESLADWLALQWGDDRKGLAAVLADPARFRYMSFRTRFDAVSAGLEGEWEFTPPPAGARWPTGAVRTIDRSTAERFEVERIVYCPSLPEACDAVHALADTLPLPRPDAPADAASTAQWRAYVYTRTCTPRAPSMPAPRYPPSARRLGQGGNVALRLVVDPCGQVHDAWVERSSGVVEMDRASVQTALRWRIPMSTPGMEPGRGATMRVPVSFVPESPPAPPAVVE